MEIKNSITKKLIKIKKKTFFFFKHHNNISLNFSKIYIYIINYILHIIYYIL